MTTVVEALKIEAAQRFVIRNVSWEQYVAISDALPERAARITFDGSSIELMTKSALHEWLKEMLGRLIPMVAFEWDIPIRSGGEMTFRRRRANRGLEPDQCYWIANERAMRGKTTYDSEADPPPDLAVEIDVTHSSLNRQEIYAKLRVPELWRFSGETLRVLVLGKSGKYKEVERSPAFPTLPVGELVPFLMPDEERDETTMLRQFVEWVRQFRPEE
ncbi:MAG: Uma2 family endonuclease [Planctomycetes bacterium]|nr:Uma2 family endonuclease [Planctomycetota bacterium]